MSKVDLLFTTAEAGTGVAVIVTGIAITASAQAATDLFLGIFCAVCGSFLTVNRAFRLVIAFKCAEATRNKEGKT